MNNLFISLKTWKALNEGGSAIGSSRPVSFIEARETIEWVKKEVVPFLGITENDIEVIGSYGKKREGEEHGDIDIAVLEDAVIEKNGISENEVMGFIESALKEKGFETNTHNGFNIISFGAPIMGRPENGLVQVDLMLTPSLEWSKFIYHSPDFKKGESAYKGSLRNIFLMAIISETGKEAISRTDKGEIEELEYNIIRTSKGLWRTRKNWKGKKGELVKTGKLLKEFDRLVTTNPDEVTALAVGQDYSPDDISTFEKLWSIFSSEDFIWRGKREEIMNRFLLDLERQGFETPAEIKEYL